MIVKSGSVRCQPCIDPLLARGTPVEGSRTQARAEKCVEDSTKPAPFELRNQAPFQLNVGIEQLLCADSIRRESTCGEYVEGRLVRIGEFGRSSAAEFVC